MSEFKTVIWQCAKCGERISQRFHVPTDGDPEKSAPTPPGAWEVRNSKNGLLYLCENCVRTMDDADIVAGRTYSDMPPDVAEQTWQEYHICLHCTNLAICKHAPDNDGCELLITVAACKMFKADEETD